MNAMTYKGYAARVEFDARDNILVGRIAGIRDVVGFHAETVAELRAAFEEAVDDYVETCAKGGRNTPEKSASGKMMLRVPPEVHGSAIVAAETAGNCRIASADFYREAA